VGTQALRGINMQIEDGEFAFLVGPSGSGKSTIIKLITGELKPTSGTVHVNGYTLEHIRKKEIPYLRRTVGVVFQDFRLIESKTVYDNVAFAMRVIGATTKEGMLSSPLRDRFGIKFRLEPYTNEELTSIVRRSATILNIPIDEDAAFELARRSRGTPRIANRLLRRVRDFAEYENLDCINLAVTRKALELMDVDELGLDAVDRNVLETIIKKFSGGPVGLDTLAAATGEDATTIEDVVEPFLIQLGFIQRTPRGRVCTLGAYRHLKLKH
jgi:Holliday junction DNA helicase RuvB subunit